MTTSEILQIFFSRTYEIDIQEEFLDNIDYDIPLTNLHRYVRKIISLPYSRFIEYQNSMDFGPISLREITQCSSIESCTEKMCYILYDDDNRGKTFEEIGGSSMFSDVVHSGNQGALVKYGENQVKTAEQLGLAFQYFDKWYLSSLGYVFPDLEQDEQQKLLSRTLLRSPLYASVMSKVIVHDVDLTDYLSDLSISTQGRRARSIIQLLNICLNECQKNNIPWHDIIYPYYVSKDKALRRLVIKGKI